MTEFPKINNLAWSNQPLPIDHSSLYYLDKVIPGSVSFSIRRFSKPKDQMLEDTGLLIYRHGKEVDTLPFISLSFCLSGNIYCDEKKRECDQCKLSKSAVCKFKTETIDLIHFQFSPSYFNSFVLFKNENSCFADNLLSFKYPENYSQSLPICTKIRQAIDAVLSHSYSDILENIYINAQIQYLLLYSLDCLKLDKEGASFQCKFLANEVDKQKILKARSILLDQLNDPITIKELSKKVAINECYLKKGFKEIFGTTIFDFYQSKRMEFAKFLLFERGMSVTEVSDSLGYSSISHFSTAFKKHTGMKPCELLFR
jgi:AraC family transcriptional regulator